MGLRVLFPLDGSERSYRAMDRALDMLAGTPGLEITVFNVRQEGFEGASPHVVEATDVDEEDEIFPTEESSQRMLERASEICSKHGIEATERIVEGKPYERIIEESANHDIVVVHSLDSSRFKEKLRFSSTEKIARNAKASVLVVDEAGTPADP